jgi:hypothetical protein
MHRYPAFHGYYYRAPYNYRHVFEYPWHAAPHEPQDFFTGGVHQGHEVIWETQGSPSKAGEQDFPSPPQATQPYPPRPLPDDQAGLARTDYTKSSAISRAKR